jgi:pyrroline-5-carboxylate reductase
MRKKTTVGIIGWGNMGAALGTALADRKRWRVVVYDKDKRKASLARKVSVSKNINHLLHNSEVVVLAVKPQDMEQLLVAVKAAVLKNNPLVITIAAGIPTVFYESRIKGLRIMRVMPNLAAKVRESISFISRGSYCSANDVKLAKDIFSAVGEVILVSEEFMDKVTSITGSGPGFVFYFMNAIYQAALSLGFNDSEARQMTLQTFWGATKLAKTAQKDFAALVTSVASPKGTTEAGLNIFKKKKLDVIIADAVRRAYKRAKEISKQRR